MARTLPFDTKMWLHQTMVDPILLHGTEVWSCQSRGHLIREYGLYQTFGDGGHKPLIGENIKRQYIRLQMGAPRRTPFLSLRGDSGVYPLYIEGVARALDYYAILCQNHSDSLLCMTLKTQRQMADSGIPCWMSTVRQIHHKLHITEEEGPLSKADLVEKLRSDYNHSWFTDLWRPKANGKLSTRLKWYRKFKTAIKREHYLAATKTGLQVPWHVFVWEAMDCPWKPRGGQGCHTKTGRTGAIGDELHLFQCAAHHQLRAQTRVPILSHRKIIKTMKNPPLEYR